MLADGVVSGLLFVGLFLLSYGVLKAFVAFRENNDLPHVVWLAVVLVAAFGVWSELYGKAFDAFFGQYRVFLALLPLAFVVFVHLGFGESFFRSQTATSVNDFFGLYLNSEVISDLDAQGYVSLGGQRREITVLFADVRDSTKMCVQYPPEVVVQSLNHYFDAVASSVVQHGGMVDKLVGDGVLALFNAPRDLPNHAQAAFDTARDVLRRMEGVNALLEQKGLPRLNVVVGIDTGTAVVGNVGSKHLVSYTAIGDVVNMAARIQQFAEAGQIILTESTYKQLSMPIRAGGRIVDIKGKGRTIIYKVALR